MYPVIIYKMIKERVENNERNEYKSVEFRFDLVHSTVVTSQKACSKAQIVC